jgi:hypothetical protein
MQKFIYLADKDSCAYNLVHQVKAEMKRLMAKGGQRNCWFTVVYIEPQTGSPK